MKRKKIVIVITGFLIFLTTFQTMLLREEFKKITLNVLVKNANAEPETEPCECENCLPYNEDDTYIFLTCVCKEDPLDCCDCPMTQ